MICLCDAVGKQFYIQEENKMAEKFTKESVRHNLELAGYSPEELQEYINIATEFLVELLSQRGFTVEQLRERRKQITSAEIEFIDAEIAKYSPEPLPQTETE